MAGNARGHVLAPWPNRLRDGRYRWDGEEHQTPLSEPETATAIHGHVVPEPRRRRGLAVEPMTCPPNAFATGESVLRLGPGESATASWGITPIG
jgi:galactose mutarotase-like enzyme